MKLSVPVFLLMLVPGLLFAQEHTRAEKRPADQFSLVWKDQKTAQEKTVTFSAKQISLKEALDIVTRLTGTKYRIEGSTVMVVPQDAADDKIAVRMYNVLPNVGQRLKAVGMDIGQR
jgi:hypothetical protein